MSQFATLLFEMNGSVATLMLNRPDKLNSFTRQMHEELRAAFTLIEGKVQVGEVRALLITGAGRAFCAGQDLSERRREPNDSPPDLGASLRDNYNPLTLRIAKLPVPVIVAVNGVASGAGANFALACDLVLAARSAVFSQPFSRIGLVPDAGGTFTLPRLIGMARAKGWCFLAENLSAEEAQRWGLIWQVVDDAELLPTATQLAANLANQATRSFALQKQAFAASMGNSLQAQLELEAQLQAQAAVTDDYREGVASFFAKRKPQFKGR